MSDIPTKSRFHLSPAETGVLAFTALYMAVWLVASFISKNDEFVFYFVVMCVLILAVGAVHLHVRLHIGALWGLSLWGLAHMAGGLMPVPASWPIKGDSHVLYNWWIVPGMLKYDQLVHAYGFGLGDLDLLAIAPGQSGPPWRHRETKLRPADALCRRWDGLRSGKRSGRIRCHAHVARHQRRWLRKHRLGSCGKSGRVSGGCGGDFRKAGRLRRDEAVASITSESLACLLARKETPHDPLRAVGC